MTTTEYTDYVVDDDAYTTASNPPPQPQPQANAPKPRYTIRSAADHLQNHKPIEYIVDGLIEAGTVNVIYSEPGEGKTLICLDMGVSVAKGEKTWLGFSIKKCNVLFIDEETGEPHLMRRMGEVERGHHADEQTPIYSISYARFDFAKSSDYIELTNLITVSNAGLVIIDALSDIAPGRNENSTDEMKPVLMNLRHIAANTGAAIILIHHANKQGGYRGASTIKADVDLMIKVEKEKDTITFTSNKVRYGAAKTFSALMNWFSLDPKSFWLTASANVPKPQSKRKFPKGQQYVLRYLLKNGKSKVDDITDSADVCKPATARNSLYALADPSIFLVERADQGGRGSTAEYQLTPDGRTEATKL